jgi:drug/metabolite transporter (DMT)-like permease
VAVAALALLGAAAWGTGDFLGGVAARRIHVLTVLVLSQAIGLGGAVVWLLASGDRLPGTTDLLPAAGAGACGAIGLAALYRGMAVGAMGIVAPISAASPVVPLAVDVGRGASPSPAQWAGIAAVLGGIVLLAREPGAERRTPLAAGVALALVVALAASVSCRPPVRLLPAIAAVGVFDTTANILVAFATTKGSAGVVAVLSALYPVVTILLARVVLGERLDRPRRLGGVLALGGAAVVAAG